MKTESVFKIFWIAFLSLTILLLLNKKSILNYLNSTKIEDSNSISNHSTRKIEYCSYCGQEITGGGTEQFGKIYCDLKCYADAN